MARKLVTTLVDDIDGSDADETESFPIDGNDYNIELSAENVGRIKGILTSHIAAGRVTVSETQQRTAKTSDVRAWDKRHGYPTSSHGRITAETLRAFKLPTAQAQPGFRASPGRQWPSALTRYRPLVRRARKDLHEAHAKSFTDSPSGANVNAWTIFLER